MSDVIIGRNLDKYFEGSEDVAKKVYTHPYYHWEIWEVEDSMIGYMASQSEADFYNQAGEHSFWRGAAGTIFGKPDTTCMIHGSPLMVWQDFYESDKSSYPSLHDYLQHMQISTETNLIAAFKDLAKWNNISVVELLEGYE